MHVPRAGARARRILVIATVSLVSVGATAAAALVVNTVPDVPVPPPGWTLNGAARPISSGVELTQAGRLDEAGSTFALAPVDLTEPTTIQFDATMSGGGAVGADGMALVFADAQHGGSPNVVGENASALGYGGIPGIAVTLDTYQNAGDPNDNFVGIANGVDDDGVPVDLAKNVNVPDLRVGTHHLQVDTTPGHLDVSVDGRLVLSLDVALPNVAYVGFTAANGGYTDNHDVTNIDMGAASANTSVPSATSPPSPTTTSAAPSGVVSSCVGVPLTGGQSEIDLAPAGTTFCVSGTHDWDLTPKSGDRLIGPAILDGQGTTEFAIEPGKATNVTLSDLEIRNYVPGYQLAAIESNQYSTGWTLQNLQVHDNGTNTGGAGASLGPGWDVQGGRYYNNRQKGLSDGLGDDATVNGAEIDHNNYTNDTYTTANVSCADDAGGFKWVANNITVENSNIHDNACVGLWMDINADSATITNNQISDNWDEGILIEISHNTTITGNTITGNGFHSFRANCPNIWMYGGGITLASSDHATITDNTVTANCNGITATQELRPDGNPGLLQNINIHNNTIAGPGGKTGAAANPPNLANLPTRNITFENNTTTNTMNYCTLTC